LPGLNPGAAAHSGKDDHEPNYDEARGAYRGPRHFFGGGSEALATLAAPARPDRNLTGWLCIHAASHLFLLFEVICWPLQQKNGLFWVSDYASRQKWRI